MVILTEHSDKNIFIPMSLYYSIVSKAIIDNT
jgi:hypothetical protein